MKAKATPADVQEITDALMKSPEFSKMFDRIADSMADQIAGVTLAAYGAGFRAKTTEALRQLANLKQANQDSTDDLDSPDEADADGRYIADEALAAAREGDTKGAAARAADALLTHHAEVEHEEFKAALAGFIDHILGAAIDDPEADAAATGATVAVDALVAIHEGRPVKDVAADFAASLLDDFEDGARAENLAELAAFIENIAGVRVSSVA